MQNSVTDRVNLLNFLIFTSNYRFLGVFCANNIVEKFKNILKFTKKELTIAYGGGGYNIFRF